jgi:hypothetical protein
LTINSRNKAKYFISNKQAFLLGFFAIIITAFSIAVLPYDIIDALREESGPLENGTVLAYAVCAVMALIYAQKGLWRSGVNGCMIFTAFALRELDFHKRFTVMSVTKTKFFVSPDVTLTAKLISGVILTALITLLFLLVKNNFTKLLSGIKTHEKWAFSAVTGIALLPMSVVLDSTRRWLTDLGVELLDTQQLIFGFSEDLVELAIAVFFLMAFFQWKKSVVNIPDK